jgi:hypothetical protein
MKSFILSGIFNFQTEPTIKILIPQKFKNKYIEYIVKISVPNKPKQLYQALLDPTAKLTEMSINHLFPS